MILLSITKVMILSNHVISELVIIAIRTVEKNDSIESIAKTVRLEHSIKFVYKKMRNIVFYFRVDDYYHQIILAIYVCEISKNTSINSANSLYRNIICLAFYFPSS